MEEVIRNLIRRYARENNLENFNNPLFDLQIRQNEDTPERLVVSLNVAEDIYIRIDLNFSENAIDSKFTSDQISMEIMLEAGQMIKALTPDFLVVYRNMN